jgi:two-component system response regulator YesN
MLKVFLAEDEFVVREGIKNNIDWTGRGYEFCGEAGDGELAYSMIQNLKPDIVITDIKMPFMDGLTLSRMIKAEFPSTEIILLTGYEDFEYAKEAIRIGVSSYLSKPISGDGLLAEVDAVAARIIEKNREKEIRSRYLEDMKERDEIDKREFFGDLITGRRDLPYILKRAKELHIEITALRYNIILFKLWSAGRGSDEYSNSVVRAGEILPTLASKYGALVFDLDMAGGAFLFKADTEDKLKENIDGCIAEMKSCFARFPHVRYFGGVGQMVDRISDLPVSFAWAGRAFAHTYLSSDDDFLQGSEERLHPSREDVILSEIDPRHIDRRLIREFLRRGEETETGLFLDEFIKGMGKSAIKSTMLRQYIAMDIYFCVDEFVESELGLSRDDISGKIPAADILADEMRTREYLEDIISSAVLLRKKNTQGRYGDVVGEVISFIEEHYSDEELSLNTLAAHVNFSPNHLSAVFRQQTGNTFIKYLTDYRLEKAKELLLSTSKKSNEIGAMVGYKDPHYFSYLFKKTLGMTTTQYRSGVITSEDEE